MLDNRCKKPQKVYTELFSHRLMKRLVVTVLLLFAVTATGTSVGEESGQEVIVTVDSTNLRFSPSSVTIVEGDTVRFFWSGELLAHNAVAEDGLFDSGEASRNVDYAFTFEIGTNGTHQYICEPHEEFGMIGTVIVEPSPPNPEPEPEPSEPGGEDASSGGTWVPFFGLEIMLSVLLIVAIYQFGRTRGIGEARLVGTGAEESEGTTAEDEV